MGSRDSGLYPDGGTAGKAFCLFDSFGLLADDGKTQKSQVNWDAVNKLFGSYSHFAVECKDTDFDTDGGFWDNIGDWWGGEDFDYSELDRTVSNVLACVNNKVKKDICDECVTKEMCANCAGEEVCAECTEKFDALVRHTIRCKNI